MGRFEIRKIPEHRRKPEEARCKSTNCRRQSKWHVGTLWDMEGEAMQQQQQQSIVEKEKAFTSKLLVIMAHFIAIGLVLYIMWHAVPGSSKIDRCFTF